MLFPSALSEFPCFTWLKSQLKKNVLPFTALLTYSIEKSVQILSKQLHEFSQNEQTQVTSSHIKKQSMTSSIWKLHPHFLLLLLSSRSNDSPDFYHPRLLLLVFELCINGILEYVLLCLVSSTQYCETHPWHWMFIHSPGYAATVLNQEWASEPPKRVCETTEGWGPTPTVYDSVGLGWDLRICISNKFLGDADAASPGATH